MNDFYTNNLVLQVAEIKDDLYERLRIVREKIATSGPDWWNPHDYPSGYYDGKKDSLRMEETFLSEILDKIEKS